MKFLENRMFLKIRFSEFFSTFSEKLGTQLRSLVTCQPWKIVKGCQYALIGSFTTDLGTFLNRILIFYSLSKRYFFAMANFQKPWELHADNWVGRNIEKVWAKVWNEVKWSYRNISHLISYTRATMSFGNRVQNLLIPKLKISTTFTYYNLY